MVNAVIATLALFGASVSATVGSAHIVNKCSYDVFMCEVPAQGGGYSTVDLTLKPGDTWDQQWTELSNGAGWSIKLSQTEGSFGSDILQYEYTFHNNGIIWYDLSCVDGTPWENDWELTANTDNCNPKQQAYRHPTDDEWGMQSCDSDASIIVTLCSSGDSGNTTSPDTYPSASYVSTNIAAYTPTPTTFATLTTAPVVSDVPYNFGGVTVVEVVTEIATATQYAKRHQHHPRGNNQHHHA